MSEFQIVELNAPSISTNFDDVKANLVERMALEKNLVITEEQLPVCKDKRAALRKEAKDIDALRKEVKKKYNEPLADFEAKCKELQEIINEAVIPIDEGIKEFDEKARKEKMEKAMAIVEDIAKKMNFSDIDLIEIDPSWGNVSKSQKAIKEEITSKIQLLQEQQRNKERRLDTFIALIEAENARLTEKMSIDMFRDAIDGDVSDAEIIKSIKNTAELVFSAENNKKDKQVAEGENKPDTSENTPLNSEDEGYLIRIYDDESTAEEVLSILMDNGYFARRV